MLTTLHAQVFVDVSKQNIDAGSSFAAQSANIVRLGICKTDTV